MEISPQALPWKSVYKLLTGSIVPRPIGWVSSLDPEGQPNLAPFSFFNAVCSSPPTLLFCPTIRGTDTAQKDTLNNVRRTGEFVINIVTEELAAAMNETSAELPAEVNEFAVARLLTEPSVMVRPPRVAASPIHFECKLSHLIDISTEPGGGSVVIGEIVHIHVRDDLLIGDDKIDIEKLKPIGRLAGPNYCHITNIFQMVRPPSRLGINRQAS